MKKASKLMAMAGLLVTLVAGFQSLAWSANTPKTVIASIKTSKGVIPATINGTVTDAFGQTAVIGSGNQTTYDGQAGSLTINMGNFTQQWTAGGTIVIDVYTGTVGQTGFEAAKVSVLLDGNTFQTFGTDSSLNITLAPKALTSDPASNNQSVVVGSAFVSPLKVFAGTGNSADPYAYVTFTAPAGFTFAGGGNVVSVYANAANVASPSVANPSTDGYATAPVLTAGTKAGKFQVTASAPGYPNALFDLYVTPGAPASVTITSPNAGYSGTVGTVHDSTNGTKPLKVFVADKFGNPYANAQVTFTADTYATLGTLVATSPTHAGAAVTVSSASDGYATAALVLGTKSGTNTVSISASGAGATVAAANKINVVGNPGPAVGFSVNPYTTTVPSSTATDVTFTGNLVDQYGNVTGSASMVAVPKDSYASLKTGTQSTVTTTQLPKGSTASAVVDLYTTQLGNGTTQTAVIQLVPFGLNKLKINLIAGESYQFTLTGGTANSLWKLATGGAGGTLSAAKGKGPVTYTAPANGAGKVDTLTVSDASLGASSTATIRIFAPIVFSSGAKVGLEKGKSTTLSAAGGALPLTFTATNDPYITVGTTAATYATVTGNAVGLGTLTVTDGYTYDGKTTQNIATIKVDVVNPIGVTPTGTIQLDTAANKNGKIGGTGGSGAYTFSSSKPAVVLVDAKGNLTGKSAGTATITVADKAYPNITATATVQVTTGMALVDAYGRAIAAAIPAVVGSGQSLTARMTGGSGSYNVSVSGPATATISSVGDLYTFTAPTTGSFAGKYTITFTDVGTGLTRSYTVQVPYRVEVSRRTILTTDTSQIVNVYGAASGDQFTVAVLDPATRPLAPFSAKGNATPPATATVAAAAKVGVDQYAATVTVKPSNTVASAIPVLIRVTKKGTGVQPSADAPMVVAPAKSYTVTVTDGATGKPIQGASVALNQPAPFAATMTTDQYGKATFSLPDAAYLFEVSNGTGYLPAAARIGLGATSATVALTPLGAAAVTYTVNVTSSYSNVRIAAFDVNNKVIPGLVSGSKATVSFDPNLFTLDRVVVSAKGAKPAVLKAAQFTNKSASVTLVGQPVIAAADLGNVVQKTRQALNGATKFDPATVTKPAGVAAIKAVLKPALRDGYAAAGGGPVSLNGNRPVVQLLVDSAGKVVSAPVIHPPLPAPKDGSTRIEDAGTTEPLTLGDPNGVTASLPSMSVVKSVAVRLPFDAFKQKVGEVFTSISAATIDSYSVAKARADLTGGELVEIDLTVLDDTGTDVYTTDSGNSLIAGVPVSLPLDAYALIAAGYGVTDAYGVTTVDANKVSAAFASGALAIWTAPSIADFEAGVGLSQLPASNVTYNPSTGEVEFIMTHFSAVGAGTGSGTTTTAGGGGGGGGSCVAPVAGWNQLLVFTGILLMLGLMMRRRRS